jgi:hypothetical protein
MIEGSLKSPVGNLPMQRGEKRQVESSLALDSGGFRSLSCRKNLVAYLRP